MTGSAKEGVHGASWVLAAGRMAKGAGAETRSWANAYSGQSVTWLRRGRKRIRAYTLTKGPGAGVAPDQLAPGQRRP